MEKSFSISKAAKTVNMTTETLRYYDRIGLVHPSYTDKWNKYRYYSEKDIVIINTVRALSCMGIPLKGIKKVLELSDIKKIVKFLNDALIGADKKISELQDAKQRIVRAKNFYESKVREEAKNDFFIRNLPKRTILLSDSLTQPTIDNLWNYHRHFYSQIGEDKKEEFTFEDLAGIYESGDTKRLFAVCEKYSQADKLIELPAGEYLCAECKEEDYRHVMEKLISAAKLQYCADINFTVSLIVLTGILRWKYEVQILIRQNV